MVYRKVLNKGIPNNSMYIARFARPGGLITDIPISHSFPDMYYFKVLNNPIKR